MSTLISEAPKVNILISDLYTEGYCRIATSSRNSTVTVTIGCAIFQCTGADWQQMCRAYLAEIQAPGVLLGHNTQEENAR